MKHKDPVTVAAAAEQAIETVIQHDSQVSAAHTDVSTDSTAATAAAVHAHEEQAYQLSPPTTDKTAQTPSEGVPSRPPPAAGGGWGGVGRESGVLMGEKINEDLFSHVVLEEGDCGPVNALQVSGSQALLGGGGGVVAGCCVYQQRGARRSDYYMM